MKVINQKNDNLWLEVERAYDEETPSGYKMACIEAEKAFKNALKEKGYPYRDVGQTLSRFSWKFSNREDLKKAITKTEQIKETFDYQLSSFETEDIIAAYKQSIKDIAEKKPLSWKKKAVWFYQDYLSFKASFIKKLIIGTLIFFLIIKFLAKTSLGQNLVAFLVSFSDLIYSWFMLFIILIIGIGILVIIVFAYLEGKRTKIENNDQKRT